MFEQNRAKDGLDKALGIAREQLRLARQVDFKRYEALSAHPSLLHMTARTIPTLLTVLETTEHLIGALPRLLEQGPFELGKPGYKIRPVGKPGPAVAGEPTPLKDNFCQELGITLTSLETGTHNHVSTLPLVKQACSKVVPVVAMAEERLHEAIRGNSKWAVICEGEEARRKVQHSLFYVMTFAARLFNPVTTTELFPEESTELALSLSVRRALMAFRTEILDVTADLEQRDQPGLAAAVLRIQAALIDLFEQHVYGDLRAQDRFVLHRMRVTAEQWLEAPDASGTEALAFLRELRRYADSLAATNKRVILLLHDRKVRDRGLEVVAGMAAGSTKASCMDLCAGLTSLAGRDLELDQKVIALWEAGEDLATLRDQVADLAAHLRRLDLSSAALDAMLAQPADA